MKSAAVIPWDAQNSRRALICTKCGVSTFAACDCGAPYERARERATKAVTANPRKSNRAIAADIGVDEGTVRTARKETAENSAVARVGRDGKTRKSPTRKKRPSAVISDPIKEINAFHQEAVKFLTDYSQRFEMWIDSSPLIDADGKATLMQALYLCSDGFARLSQKLDGR